ncbi:winged helix-turn-helix transcriptional regulator [Nocardia sp. CWNU-33]|uniref:winged helix-turn-helix transcriptional regulator n=1 Tax=Nocardia sp. CWNU-33 TaxID=3392117 RepID=UPI00398F5042
MPAVASDIRRPVLCRLPTYPPQVEYALTERGQSLSLPIFGLVEWSRDNHESMQTGSASAHSEKHSGPENPGRCVVFGV